MRNNVKLYVSLFALTLSLGFFNADAMKRVEKNSEETKTKESLRQFIYNIATNKLNIREFEHYFFLHYSTIILATITDPYDFDSDDFDSDEEDHSVRNYSTHITNFTVSDFKKAYPTISIPKRFSEDNDAQLTPESLWMIAKMIEDLKRNDFSLTKQKADLLKITLSSFYCLKKTIIGVLFYPVMYDVSELYEAFDPLAILEPLIRKYRLKRSNPSCFEPNLECVYYDGDKARRRLHKSKESFAEYFKTTLREQESSIDYVDEEELKLLRKKYNDDEDSLVDPSDLFDEFRVEEQSRDDQFIEVLASHFASTTGEGFSETCEIIKRTLANHIHNLYLFIPVIICDAILSLLIEKVYKDTFIKWNDIEKTELLRKSEKMLVSNEMTIEEKFSCIKKQAYPFRLFLPDQIKSCYENLWKTIFGPALEEWAFVVNSTGFINNLKKNTKYRNVRIICFIE